MNELDKLISQLQQLSWQIKNRQNNNDKNTLINTIHALLKEGNQHHQSTWLAHMTSPVTEAAQLGQSIANLHNGNLLSAELYPVLDNIAQQTLDWLCKLFGQRYGHPTAGSSYGNLEALWQAKQSSNRNIVYASDASHYSIVKACQILGLELVLIPSSNEQLDITKLHLECEKQPPLAIIANAGTTTSGAFDSISDCIQIAQQYEAWCHIDAAWGGGFKLLPDAETQFGSLINQANSICFDPHKIWGQPKPCSFLFYQQPLSKTSVKANYLQQQPDWQLHGSRGGEAYLPLWFTLQTDGHNSLIKRLQHNLKQAQILEKYLIRIGLDTVLNHQTGIICFSTNVDLTALVEKGLISNAIIDQKPVYRCVFNGFHTVADDLITQLQPYF